MILRKNNYNKERIAKYKIQSLIKKSNKYELVAKVENPFNTDVITKFKFVAIRDTILVRKVMDKSLSCIREKYCIKSSITHKLVPLYKISNETTGNAFYAKHLGVISYSTISKSTGESFSWELEKIIDYEDWLINI